MNENPCPFEKAITSNRCGCEYSSKFAVAERIGIACRSGIAQRNCVMLLGLLKERARFALKVSVTPEKLPFGKELQVMIGGLCGLGRVMNPSGNYDKVDNIHALLRAAQEEYGSLTALPFHEIVKSIAHYRPRRRTDYEK